MKIAGLLAVSSMIAISLPSFAAEEESPFEASADITAVSHYVWRGIVVMDTIVLQPSITLGKSGFSINVWNNFDLTDRVTGRYEFSETDLTLAYQLPFEDVDISFGAVQYLYSNQPDAKETRELFATAGLPIDLAGLPGFSIEPSIALYYDIEDVKGLYGSAALAVSYEFMSNLSASLAYSMGAGSKDFNDYYFSILPDSETEDLGGGLDNKKTSLVDGNLVAVVDIGITDKLTLTPAMGYPWLWDSDLRAGAESL